MHVKTVCIKQTPPKMHENHGIFYNPEKNTTKNCVKEANDSHV